PLLGLACIPVAIGIAFIILGFFNPNKARRRPEGDVMSKSLRDLHDVELAAQAAAGGRREYGELVRRHGSAVRGLLRRMGAAPSLADDVAQDAFLQGFQRCSEFRGQGTFAGWIKKIAARLYLKRVAREARYVAEAEADEAAPARDRAGSMDLDEAL
ncbi:sigma-70 family, partial [Streptomyces coelicoflavus ZG0656]